MRTWILRGAGVLLVGTLLGSLPGCGHNPNHGIDMEEARKAAARVHTPPKPQPGVKMEPGHGG
ncbi:MAG: hypothetical protein K0Q72_2221 [Armatimonadetes bacterium]|jgi:hypothetical protein|nr:hypothetical protein [Armatimonadota bacterium]